jgi:amidohydrolase
MQVKRAIEEHLQTLIQWRHDIHARPELAFEEHKTSAFVADKLAEWGVAVTRGIAGTGVVGTLQAGKSARSIGLRADMDALPMQEQNHFPHRSKVDGCFHGCGHDGHTIMLLGAARYLSQTRSFDGTVHFIFQPAEEMAGGAGVMVDEGLFERFRCDEVYALHNWPALPLGKIAVRGGGVMAAADQWDLDVNGKGGHAAFPDLTVDPIFVATQIIQAWQGLVSRETRPTDAAVISTTRFTAGSAYNVIPDGAKLGGTARSIDPRVRDRLEQRMGELARSVAAGWGAEAVFRYKRGYPVTVNDQRCASVAALAAGRVVGEAGVVEDYEPSMGGEDFSYMLEARPGVYIWLGQGTEGHPAPLHSTHYDFNDDALAIGASLHVELVESQLRQ